MYRIERITDRDGNDRIDGRYPRRIGCVVEEYQIALSHPMLLDYIRDNEGNEKMGCLRTSVVEGYSKSFNDLKVYTSNSIYYLKEIDE